MTALTPEQLADRLEIARAALAARPIVGKLNLAAERGLMAVSEALLDQTAKLEAVQREIDDRARFSGAPPRQWDQAASLPSAPAKTADGAYERAARVADDMIHPANRPTRASNMANSIGRRIRALKSPTPPDENGR
jgi:hypothetical protein